jgi:OmcA/MtrC family decaheme c-type cytochrome
MDFPGKLNNCETCHVAGTYSGVPANALASTYESINAAYSTAIAGGVATPALAKTSLDTANAADTVNSPYVAACVSCHQSPWTLNEHIPGFTNAIMQKPRSVFQSNVGQSAAENCAGCHGVGKASDVTVFHKK